MDARTRGNRLWRSSPLEDVTLPPAPRNYYPAGQEPAIEVKLKPVKVFPSERAISASTDLTLTAGDLPAGCRGFRIISVVGTVLVDINGGGTRTVLDRDTYDQVEISSLRVITAAASTCILQMWGEG